MTNLADLFKQLNNYVQLKPEGLKYAFQTNGQPYPFLKDFNSHLNQMVTRNRATPLAHSLTGIDNPLLESMGTVSSIGKNYNPLYLSSLYDLTK